ncbi:MAG TPA: DUF1501 domain-containing protein, partial [Pirellulaceae bacterium]|nr:DUF1501 domain-containing protein [Pirellulaceae bacterium]
MDLQSAIRNPQSAIPNCPSRRDFIRIGGLTALGLGLIDFLALRQASAAAAPPMATRTVLIWLDGGPSHLETFDLKPDAPVEARGPFQPTSTNVPGIQICDLFERLAQRMDRAAMVRSVTSPLGEHNLGTHYMLTGYPPTPALEYPAIGSVVAHLDATNERTLPSHIAVPNFGVGGKRISGNGYLPTQARPYEVGGDPSKPDFRVENLDFFAGVTSERIDRRRDYLAALDRLSRDADAGEAPNPRPFEQAFRLITSKEAKSAFDLTKETPATRARYGPRTIGQSTLLARRLVEAGVPFVTVNYTGWDTHESLYTRLKEGYTGAKQPVGLIPSLDLALSALLDD